MYTTVTDRLRNGGRGEFRDTNYRFTVNDIAASADKHTKERITKWKGLS